MTKDPSRHGHWDRASLVFRKKAMHHDFGHLSQFRTRVGENARWPNHLCFPQPPERAPQSPEEESNSPSGQGRPANPLPRLCRAPRIMMSPAAGCPVNFPRVVRWRKDRREQDRTGRYHRKKDPPPAEPRSPPRARSSAPNLRRRWRIPSPRRGRSFPAGRGHRQSNPYRQSRSHRVQYRRRPRGRSACHRQRRSEWKEFPPARDERSRPVAAGPRQNLPRRYATCDGVMPAAAHA